MASANLILILAASGFASTFSGRAVEPMVGILARDLGTPVETIALLSAAFSLPYAFIQPVLGPIGDALGKERIMKICLAVLFVSLLGSVLAPGAQALFVLRITAGIAAGGVVPLALALIADKVDMASRQVAISRFLIAIITGQLAGSSLAGILAEFMGWRGVFALASGLMLLAFTATAVGFRGTRTAGTFNLDVAVRRYGDILGNPRARTLFALVFVEAIAIFGIFPYIAPLLEMHGKGGAAEAGFAIGGFAIGGLAYSALVGWMLRRLGLRWMLVAGGVIAASALLALGFTRDWKFDALALMGLGLGFYMLHNSFQTQVTEVAPQARASAVALHAFSFFCGQALGVVAIGRGLQWIGQAPTLALAALIILATGVVAAVALTRGMAQPRAR
jgi:predicted MFS family arabinose efflux permease